MSTDNHKLIKSIAGGNGELVLQFFAVFSLFECALKRTGFVKRDKFNNALADWDKFADKLNGQLAATTSPDFVGAKSHLLAKPPQKQKFTKPDGVQWEENNQRLKESDVRYLLRLVRDVRNNLFHGGKYPMNPVDEPVRNSSLLEACLTILDKCRSLDAAIERVFDDALREAY